MSSQSDLQLISSIAARLDAAKPANFSYTEEAYQNNEIEGVETFDINAGQNTPAAELTEYNPFLLDKGIRAQGASIPRMAWNHYIGRFSFNLRKLTEKFTQFLGIFTSALAHNANEYDPAARYAGGDICYTTAERSGVKVYTWYKRVSVSPGKIQNVPPDVALHWAPMQESTSYDSLLPFAAPGFRHKFTIADLTGSEFNTEYYYPCVTESLGVDVEQVANPAHVLIEAFTRGVPPGATNEIRADLLIQTKFTGFGGSSKDIVLDDAHVQVSDGAALSLQNSPIGYSKLPKGKQAVIWLKGGQKYALYNSFGVDFALHQAEWTNSLDTAVAPVGGARPFEIVEATVRARLETPDAVKAAEAPNLAQVTGALPLPVKFSGGENLRVIRRPGKYVALTVSIGNSITDGPAGENGIFDLTVKGDVPGLTITVQQLFQRATGCEYSRVLAGNLELTPWYKSSCPTGMEIHGVNGLFVFDINDDGHLVVHYGPDDDPPPFHVDSEGHLIWDGAGAGHELDLGLVKTVSSGYGIDGLYVFDIDNAGHLIVYYGPRDAPPPFYINNMKHLIWEGAEAGHTLDLGKVIPTIEFMYNADDGHLYYKVD